MRDHLPLFFQTNNPSLDEIQMSANSRWWELVQNKEVTIPLEKQYKLESVTALDELNLEWIPDSLWCEATATEAGPNIPTIPTLDSVALADCETGVTRLLDDKEYDLWDDTDLTDQNIKLLPTNRMSIESSTMAVGTMKVAKTTMVAKPKLSRPVLTKQVNTEFNAVTTRIGTYSSIANQTLDPQVEANLFQQAYFKPEAAQQLQAFRLNQLTFNVPDIMNWLSERKNSVKVVDELLTILAEGFEINPLNQVNVHTKLESLLKSEPVQTMSESRARVIIWQAKGIAAIYSSVFKEAKTRLKSLLKSNVLYTDGLRPDQVSDVLRKISLNGRKWFVENDLKKQDRQTNQAMIDCEFEMYRRLGVSPAILSSWRRVHNHWRAKGKESKFFGHGMRLTGQATTALGNVIVNMLCHSQAVIALGSDLVMGIYLGDDNAMVISRQLDIKELQTTIATKYNMNSKLKSSGEVAEFCGFLLYVNTAGVLEIGPNFKRIRNRFEVTNGASKPTQENFELRCMSYAMTVGPTPGILSLARAKNWPVTIQEWYDHTACIIANGQYNEVPMEDVLADQSELIRMMSLKEVTTTIWEVFTGIAKKERSRKRIAPVAVKEAL
jgi:hypothetical protein